MYTHTDTHTHTHIYRYIYIYMYTIKWIVTRLQILCLTDISSQSAGSLKLLQARRRRWKTLTLNIKQTNQAFRMKQINGENWANYNLEMLLSDQLVTRLDSHCWPFKQLTNIFNGIYYIGKLIKTWQSQKLFLLNKTFECNAELWKDKIQQTLLSYLKKRYYKLSTYANGTKDVNHEQNMACFLSRLFQRWLVKLALSTT